MGWSETGWDGVKHSTIFKALPTEYWKSNIAMPAEKFTKVTRKFIRAVKQRVNKF
jgi:hypothetical protein